MFFSFSELHTDFFLYFFGMIPEIPRRRMTITDMFGFSLGTDPLCFGRTWWNHEIISREIESPKCQRPQEHTELMSAIEKWYILDKTFMDFSPFKSLGTSWKKDRRINLRFRIHLHELLKYPLCPTPVSNPVGNKGYSFLWHRNRVWILYLILGTEVLTNYYNIYNNIMKSQGWWTLIIEPKRAHGEKLASGVSNVDIYSPCNIVTNLQDAVAEIMQWYPLHRIIFNPSIIPNNHGSDWSLDFRHLYWEAVLEIWERTDMPHIFLYILARLRPYEFKEKSQFFTPLTILCDTDATNAEQDMRLATKPLQWIEIQTRRDILQKLNMNEKSPDWERQLWAHFAKISPRICQ